MWFILAFAVTPTNCACFSCHVLGRACGSYFTLHGVEEVDVHAWLTRLSVLRRWSAAPGSSAGSTVTSLSRWMWWCALPASSTCVLLASTGECVFTWGYHDDSSVVSNINVNSYFSLPGFCTWKQTEISRSSTFFPHQISWLVFFMCLVASSGAVTSN